MTIIDYFDDRILNILYSFTQFGVTIACLIIYTVFKKSYLKRITTGYILNAIGLSLITLRDYVPNFASVWLGNTLLILGLFITYDGIAYMFNSPKKSRIILYLVTLFSVLHFVFSFIRPDLELRIINFSFFSALGALYIVLVSFKQVMRQLNSIVLTITVTHFFHVILNTIRIINTLQQDETVQLFSNISVFKYFILYSIFLSITRLTCITLYNTKELVLLD